MTISGNTTKVEIGFSGVPGVKVPTAKIVLNCWHWSGAQQFNDERHSEVATVLGGFDVD